MDIGIIRSSDISLPEYICCHARDPVLTFPAMYCVFIVYILLGPGQPARPALPLGWQDGAVAERLPWMRNTSQIQLFSIRRKISLVNTMCSTMLGGRSGRLGLTTVGKMSITVVNACSTPPLFSPGIEGCRTMAGHRIPPSVDQAIHSDVKQPEGRIRCIDWARLPKSGGEIGSNQTSRLTLIHPGWRRGCLSPSGSQISKLPAVDLISGVR